MRIEASLEDTAIDAANKIIKLEWTSGQATRGARVTELSSLFSLIICWKYRLAIQSTFCTPFCVLRLTRVYLIRVQLLLGFIPAKSSFFPPSAYHWNLRSWT